ncbi:hypothetical protein [Kineosporia sp. A_224]|uniref:hypothetical protein n=1 Tax=Kineosporia sp. A_224 TaxID=1962180 RepID=UPI000B4ABD70|nr:hypothetical protein [Kineosporia sp. A_224]
MTRRRAHQVRPAELAALGAGLVSIVVAGLTWVDARPWPTSDGPRPVTAASPVPTAGDDAPDDAGQDDTLDDSASPLPVLGPDADGAAVALGAAAGDGSQGSSDGGPGASGQAGGAGGSGTGAAAGATEPAGVVPAAVTVRGPAARPATGRMCFFLAPDAAYGAGHNGWAFRLADGRWVEGATENNTPNEVLGLFDEADDSGSFSVEPDADADSWMRTVDTFAQVRADFRGALSRSGRSLHDAGYYTQQRCADRTSPDPAAAVAKARELTASGYWVGEDNCLTKAVEIFEAYGATLPDATYETPNDYMSWTLAPFGALRPI